MRFCEECENMLYMQIDDTTGELTYSCRYCGKTTKSDIDDHVVYRVQFDSPEISYSAINEYTRTDPTIPVTNKLPSPNAECVSAKENREPSVRYMRYNKANLKYAYICQYCDHRWMI